MIRSLAGALRWSGFKLAISLCCVAVMKETARGQTAQPAAPAAATVAPGAIASATETPPPAPKLPTVPNEVKSAPDVSSERGPIEQFITQAVHQLGDDTNPAAQSAAREALQSEALVNGQPNASVEYLDVYAQTLDKQLVTFVQNPQVSPRAKLNAAIATAQVAQAADNGQLAEVAELFINDSSDAVSLWGIKAARWIIPAQLRMVGMGPNADKLADAVVAAVKKHTKGQIAGAIAGDAYSALTLDITDPAHRQKLQQNPAGLQRMATHVLDLLQVRLQHYRKGVPPDPRAEATGTGYLSDPLVWGQLNPQIQQQAVQTMVDLVNLAADQASAAKVSAGDRGELSTMISRVSAAISIIAAPNSTGAVFDAIKPASTLRPDANGQTISEAVKGILPALKTLPAYAGLNNPPTVISNEPAPPPASAPTTGPIAAPGEGNTSAVGNPNAKIITPPPPAPTPEPAPATRPAPAPAQPAPQQPPANTQPPPRTPTPPAQHNTHNRTRGRGY